MFDFTARHPDELTLSTGMIFNVSYSDCFSCTIGYSVVTTLFSSLVITRLFWWRLRDLVFVIQSISYLPMRLFFQVYRNPPVAVSPGWLYGECNGKRGMFPESYVRKKITGKIDPFDPFGVHKARVTWVCPKQLPSLNCGLYKWSNFVLSVSGTPILCIGAPVSAVIIRLGLWHVVGFKRVRSTSVEETAKHILFPRRTTLPNVSF